MLHLSLTLASPTSAKRPAEKAQQRKVRNDQTLNRPSASPGQRIGKLKPSSILPSKSMPVCPEDAGSNDSIPKHWVIETATFLNYDVV